MADDFSQRFQYGLQDLPMEPPDDFNASNSPGGFPSTGAQHLPEPQIIAAGFRLPLPRRPAVGPLSAPPWPVPEILAPRIPDWWKVLGAAAQILPRNASGFGGGGGGERGDGDLCYRRHEAEQGECRWRDPEFRRDCNQRATHRWDLCNRNGGRPSPSEPPKWGFADEERVRRLRR